MSASNLIVDADTLRKVAQGVKTYNEESKLSLEEALRGLQTAQANWSDEDMEQLQASLQSLTSRVQKLTEDGNILAERCNKKLEALDRLHGMTI